MRWPCCGVCDEVLGSRGCVEVCKPLVKDTDLRDGSWRRKLPRFNDMSLEYAEIEMTDGLKPCK